MSNHNHQYNAYTPRMQFLQLGEERAHRSALAAAKEQDIFVLGVEERQMHVTTISDIEVDATEHTVDVELTMNSEEEVAVWAYLMTQYNLKPGL